MAAVMSYPTVDPVEGILALQRELDRFLRKPSGFDLGTSAAGVFPPLNVFRNRDALVIKAEVPGVDPATLQVQVEGRTLTIAGERPAPQKGTVSYHRRERRFGKFSRTLQLPNDVDGTKAVAECRNGVLTVTFPKHEEARPKQIRVQVA
jgi:HSP20 family protein